jgi:hypothetical protein
MNSGHKTTSLLSLERFYSFIQYVQ